MTPLFAGAMLDSQVLVLNRVFQAVQVTTLRKAFSLFYKGHVRAVLPDYSTWEWENWCDVPVQPQDEVVLTPGMAIRVPRVIALKDFDRLPRQLQLGERRVLLPRLQRQEGQPDAAGSADEAHPAAEEAALASGRPLRRR